MEATLKRRRAGILAALVATLMLAGPLADQEAQAALRDDRRVMRRLINGERAPRGLVRLRAHSALNKVAQSHTREMASANRLYHNGSLAHDLRHVNWSILGENVGVGSTLYSLHRAFMNSSGHRANILNRRFRRVGIGVVRARGRTWVTVVFKG
ncbi:MAG TPA: CAP domain-containing protein [Actinomycetota bacterium]|nr:CAP domain-containing protein [Actinomycetota bacterium]